VYEDRDQRVPTEKIEAGTGRSARSVIILFVIWAITQLYGIFSPPLLDDMDALHVEAAREMAMRHDYVTLYVDGIRYLDKPPLPYWLGAIGIHLFGMHDWAVRLPLALSVLVLTLYLYGFARRLFGENAGFYSGCVFATCVGPYIFTRFFIPDVMVALWMTIAADLTLRMIASVEKTGSATRGQTCSFALVITAGLLTKGLIGLVFPVAVLLAYLLCIGKLRAALRMRPLLMVGVVLLTALPWHILAATQNPPSGEAKGWFWFYFVNEQINRYLNKRIPRDYDKVPLVTFWMLLVIWLMPWGLYLLGAVREWWRKRTEKRESPQLLFLVWAFFVLIFFTFSTRQEYYTIPAVPALALLVGVFLSDEERNIASTAFWGKLASGILFAVGLLIAIVCGYFALIAHQPPPGLELYQAIVEHPEYYARSFGHFFDLTSVSMGFFRWPLIGTAVGMFFGTGLAFWLRFRRNFYGANLALTLAMCLVLTCVHAAYKIFYPILGSEPLAIAINQHFQPGDLIVIDGQYSDASSVGFYTGQPLYMLNGRVNNLWYGSLFADAPHRFEDDASFAKLWNSSQRVFFITDKPQDIHKFDAETHAWQIVSTSGKTVLSNRQ
jgi:4-amino-4-deoxy-L-arabinose transferase-like glycosyltransferase